MFTAISLFLSLHATAILTWLGAAIVSITVALLTLFSNVLSRFRSRIEVTKDEAALIDLALKNESGDAAYQKFLRDITKEKTVSLLFNLPIRIGKIGALMELYDQGEMTLSDIRKAWPYMRFTDSEILFLHDRDDIFLLWMTRLGLLAGLAGIVLGSFAVPFIHGLAKLELLGVIVVYLLFTSTLAISTQGLFIALRLKVRVASKKFKSAS